MIKMRKVKRRKMRRRRRMRMRMIAKNLRQFARER